MFNKQRFACLALFLILATDVAVAQPLLRFRPPNRGTPTTSRGGASRGPEQLKHLQAIAPVGNFGLTTATRPSLLVYIPKTSAKVLKVGLRSPDGKKTLFMREMPAPTQAGIVQLELTDSKTAPLEINREYRWYVALFNNAVDRSTGTIAEGRIERIQPSAKLQQQLKAARPEQRPAIYANERIWWDTVLTLNDLRRSQPQSAGLDQQWRSLLDSVGLAAIAPQAEIAAVSSK
jgi:hypothetical protein